MEQTRLLGRTPQPDAVLERASAAHERMRAVASEHHAARDQAILEELAKRPPWIAIALGPEPQEADLRERWHRTARELAGHRIDNRITGVHEPVSGRSRDTALERAIAETRAAVGLQPLAPEAVIEIER